MAAVQWTEERPVPGEVIYTWAGVINSSTPAPVIPPGGHNDRTIQISGTPGAGLAIDVQGSNQTVNPGTEWASLREPGNAKLNTLLVTANLGSGDMRQILESTQQVKPVLSGGDGTTALTIRLKCSSQARR
jgi:hypothetical protein